MRQTRKDYLSNSPLASKPDFEPKIYKSRKVSPNETLRADDASNPKNLRGDNYDVWDPKLMTLPTDKY